MSTALPQDGTRRPPYPQPPPLGHPPPHDASVAPPPAAISVSLDTAQQRADAPAADSVTDAASLSPWTGLGSPSSSDFEAVSDSEVLVPLASSACAPLPAQPTAPQSNLARSLSQRRVREESHGSGGLGERRGMYDDDHRRGIEGDDEDSSAFEDADREEGRGRARTRRARDPELNRSMLEDALRSSLATLLSLTPGQAGMSQTPSMSHASLASLFQPTASSSSSSASAGASASSASTGTFHRRHPVANRASPFATALSNPLDEEEDESSRSRGGGPASYLPEDVFTSSSSSSSPSADEHTQFAPNTRTRAIPILAPSSRARPAPAPRGYSDTATASYSNRDPYAAAGFSPLVPSQPLGAPSSGSPPQYSRSGRRGGERAAPPGRRRGGRGRGGSASPGPASVEERRRARAAAGYAAGGAGAAGVVTSEGERDGVERDEAFQELVDAARFFSDLSPRPVPRAPPVSLPSSYETARPRSTSASWAPHSVASAVSTPPFYSDEDDPALASESVPTLEGLSSGPECEGEAEAEQAFPPGALPVEKRATGGEQGAQDPPAEAEGRPGWLSWLRGLGKTVEIKVWHLVGICGLLIGVGIGASSLVRTLAPASWLATRLDFAHHASPFLAPSSPSARAIASGASTDRFASASPPPSEGMSSLFVLHLFGMAAPRPLEGKVAIITGGGSGIGLATAKAFLAAGAAGITLVDLRADALAAAVASLGLSEAEAAARVLTVAGDVADEATAEAYANETAARFGRVDVSVQCAGISPPACDVVDLDVDEWDRTIRVNLRGVFLGVKHSLKAMLASPSGGQGCSVVLVSSQLGLDGYPGAAAYSASKFALRGLMTSVAAEVGQRGIRVNAVAPGPIDTPMLAGWSAEGHTTKGNIKRAGRPEEVAHAVLFLAGEAGAYCSGTTLKVDGGWSKWC
ncbi:hypothetical protein JCM3770_003387 [Rhodotorula araucariae]